MKIASFNVTRFRSIEEAECRLHDMTILLGPNNEGKSNILRAMVIGMEELSRTAGRLGRYRRRPQLRGRSDAFDWERDFPLHLRETGEQTTVLEFAFALSDQEVAAFTAEVGSRINGDLRVSLTFDQNNRVEFKVIKQRVGPQLTESAAEVAAFIAAQLSVEYVASIRTAQEASDVVSRLVAAELRTLEFQSDYSEALRILRVIEERHLREVGESVTGTLQHFMPNVRQVSIALRDDRPRRVPLHAIEMVVDDGQPTPLEMKGDGVQSLAAVALLRRSAMDRSRASSFVLAVEEPEAHLHPLAIRELRQVLSQIAEDQQVVVTTHSPLLADPLRVDCNTIVQGNAVRPARTIAEVRDSLGVRLEDNLQSARLSLVVEGATDAQIFRALIPTFSESIANHLEAGTVVIEHLGGGSNLSYRLSQYSTGVCDYYAVVDKDEQGRRAIEAAQKTKLLSDKDYRMLSYRGKHEGEIEDLIDPAVYLDVVNSRFGLSLAAKQIMRGKGKWSRRIAQLLEDNGKNVDDDTVSELKWLVADAVAESPTEALLGDTLVSEIVKDLEGRLYGWEE